MKKHVSIDDLLAENELTLTINGKDYVVCDIQMDAFLKATQMRDGDDMDQGAIYGQLALFFNADLEDIKQIGIRAAGLAIREINAWMQKETEDMKAGLSEDQPNVNP